MLCRFKFTKIPFIFFVLGSEVDGFYISDFQIPAYFG